ncbi:triple tyrosine motif-containing protein [Salinimicrobium sp. TIG7-5_MAKvit]|uniref:helix-turn-helix and ligand-binding sensor domain-containing protein n=1 Tax=Salinimicrobium sp. TIG7-5_MAKvit TaxID=3121289 RepID=UPI003C6DD97D
MENLPKITHYSRKDFHSDSQFWTMTRDAEGILYFGNNDGVVIYDGERWHKVFLPNNSSVRSLTTSKSGEVYAGGYNEIGKISKDSIGNYRYLSLLEDLKLQKEKLENLWQVHEFKDHIIFRSFDQLIVISGKTVTHISSNTAFTFSDVIQDRYYVQDAGHGIFEFDPDKMKLNLLYDPESYDNDEIKAFLPTGKKDILIVSKQGNIYEGKVKSKELHLKQRIFNEDFQDQVISAIKHKENYLLGTLASKIILLTSEGEIIKESPAFADIHDSSVLQLYADGDNFWALLNNGLDFIEFDAPFSQLFSEASIYDILIDEDKILVATNKGVFTSDLMVDGIHKFSFNFKKVLNLEGQAWSIQKVNNSIFVGHDKGLFLLEDGNPLKIGNVDGFWKITPIKDAPEKYLASNYNGLYLLTKTEGKWALQNKLKGFDESTRDIIQADQEDTYWVCHGFKGVYKLKINKDYTRVYAFDHYTNQNGLDSPFNINVTRWNNDIVFTTNTGIFEFDEESNEFVPHVDLNKILDSRINTRKLLQDNDRVWVVQDDQVGYFNLKEENPRIIKDLFLNLKGSLNRGMESIQPLPNGKVLIGATTGLYLYNINRINKKETSTSITHVSYIQQNSGEKKIPIISKEKVILPPRIDILRFEFASPGSSPSSIVQYQYLLKGIDENWSTWDESAYKEYTHLRPGDYIFKVRSRDILGNTGEEVSFPLSITSPWYRTTTAYLVYCMGLIGLSLLLIYFIKLKIERERQKAKDSAQKNAKLLELEIEQLKLEKDKAKINRDKKILEEDNLLKSKELANYTMMLVKKKDVFTETYENLQDFKKTLKTQSAKKRLQEVLVRLNQHRIGEEFMVVFDTNFEKVHKNFFTELKKINPTLTQRELRLCAFVKMNLTNKEIAPLLNISVRGVETARYRVRKKLNVQDINFLTFLEDISKAFPEDTKL